MNCIDFGNPLIKSILEAQRLKEIATGPAPRLRKTELNNSLRQINILRQDFSSKFSETTQEILKEKVPSISLGIDDNDFERVEIFATVILDALIKDGIPTLIKCICLEGE